MRNRIACVRCVLLLLSATAAPAAAQDQVVELGLMRWGPSPGLTLSSEGLVGSGIGEVDFVREFGIVDKSFPNFRVALGRSHKLRVSHAKFSYDPETVIQRTFTFQGRTFALDTPASADIEWDLWTLGYEWDVVSRERGFFGIVADLKYNRIKASIASPALAAAAATDTTAPVPTIGVAGRSYIGSVLSVGGEFTGLKSGWGGLDVKFTDFDVNATIVPNSRIGIGAQVGYRSVVADYVVDEDTGNLKMKGPYFGVIARF
jgi:opacity protein-like surface antigen